MTMKVKVAFVATTIASQLLAGAVASAAIAVAPIPLADDVPRPSLRGNGRLPGQQCDVGNVCVIPYICVNGICSGGLPGEKCDLDHVCADGSDCVDGVCTGGSAPTPSSPSVVPLGGVCGAGDVCIEGTSCIDGICKLPPLKPRVAPGGVCRAGIDLCTPGYSCLNGTCQVPTAVVPAGGPCRMGVDTCATGYSCIDGFCATHSQQHQWLCGAPPTSNGCTVNCNCYNNDCADCHSNCNAHGCAELPMCGSGCNCNGGTCCIGAACNRDDTEEEDGAVELSSLVTDRGDGLGVIQSADKPEYCSDAYEFACYMDGKPKCCTSTTETCNPDEVPRCTNGRIGPGGLCYGDVCMSGFTCRSGRCRAGNPPKTVDPGGVCQAGIDRCTIGYSCIDGRCAIPAVPAGGVCRVGIDPCITGYVCINGVCAPPTVPAGGVCRVGVDTCVTGYTCINGICSVSGMPKGSDCTNDKYGCMIGLNCCHSEVNGSDRYECVAHLCASEMK